MKSLYRSCELARRAGCIIVAAEGRGKDSYPSIFEPVIGVGMRSSGDPFRITASRNPMMDCEARGVQTARGLGGVTRRFSGSSFAAPVVAGHIARFLEKSPSANLDDVRRMLRFVSSLQVDATLNDDR
jgi:subtilisin family serine protease